jgi:protein SCO1/2
MRGRASLVLFSVALAAALPVAGKDAAKLPPLLTGIGIDQNLNDQLPLNTQFLDQDGNTVALGSYFLSGKPVLLAPVYYRCPMLCSQVLTGVVEGLRPLSLTPGKDFEVVAVSINPMETPDDGRAKRDYYSELYSKKAGPKGWTFLVGKQPSIDAVTHAIGFKYRWDDKHKMFVHASGIMILTPEGRIARYLYGVQYQPKDLKLSLIEASHDKIGSAVDQVLLFCYHYDPKTGKYGAVVINLVRIGGGLTLMALAVGLSLLWRRDLREGRGVLKELSRE